MVLAALLVAMSVGATETDPYTNRDIDIADSAATLDAWVNEALDDIAASWRRDEDEWAFVMAVYRKLGGLHWIDKLERRALRAPEIAKVPITRGESVFAGLCVVEAHLARVGLGQTINVNGAYIGTDKIGHFFSQGRKFYGRYRRLGTLERAAGRTAAWESLIWGGLTSRIYSNADLVANYEGYLFYRSLFHDDAVAGRKAVFRWDGGQPVRQRAFTWADHVSAFWDETLNPNSYPRALVPYMQRRLLRLCDDFAQRPDRYRVHDLEALSARYSHLGMRDNNTALRPDSYLTEHCPRQKLSFRSGPDFVVGNSRREGG